MRHPLPVLVCTAAAALGLPAGALAAAHTVTPGETLWSIAVANGLRPEAVAAANGLPADAHVIAGTVIDVPPPGAAPGAEAGSGEAPPALGAYTVRPGDTLSGIAARSGAPAAQIAAMNGLDVAGPLLAGTVIKLPTGAPNPEADGAATAPQAGSVPDAEPYATSDRLAGSQIGAIASQYGVPPALAEAVAWQESGFNNAFVSAANARGIMQILPGTWDWVQYNLITAALDPASATDNVRAGVLYLHQLLEQTGGDQRTAVAGYYQGLGSVRDHGLLDDTQRYVDDVMALAQRFGG